MAITRLGGANAISGTIPAANIATLTSSNLPTGSVIQVKHGTLGVLSTNSTSFSIIGSISITPTSASNKIFVTYTTHDYITNASSDEWRGCLTQLLRDSTVILTDGTNGYGNGTFFEGDNDRTMSYTTHSILDSPSTTSAITYQVDGKTKQSGVNAIFNNSGYGSQGKITVMEIKG